MCALNRGREANGRREAGIAVVFMIGPLRRQSFAVARSTISLLRASPRREWMSYDLAPHTIP
jgi:hypothetical protein